MKEKGESTLGIKVWFDPITQRLKDKETGIYIDEFFDDEKILVVLEDGHYYLINIEQE